MLLLYLILNYSTFKEKTYKHMLTVSCLLDATLSIITFVSQPVVLLADGYFMFASNGFLANESRLMCALMLGGYCLLVHSNVVWVAMQFLWRYQMLSAGGESQKRAIAVRVAFAVWFFMGLAMCTGMFSSPLSYQAHGIHVMDRNGWPRANDSSLPYAFGSYLMHPRMYCWLSGWTFSTGLCFFIVVWSEYQIMKRFKSVELTMRSSTRRMHAELHRALIAMAVCPFVTSLGPITFFIVAIATASTPGLICALMLTVISSITLVNPLTTICLVRCYRKALMEMFNKRSMSVSPYATTEAGKTEAATEHFTIG